MFFQPMSDFHLCTKRSSSQYPIISLKLNVIARLEFEIAYYDVAVLQDSDYNIGIHTYNVSKVGDLSRG